MFYRTMILRAVLLVKMKKKVYPLLVRLRAYSKSSLATFKRGK